LYESDTITILFDNYWNQKRILDTDYFYKILIYSEIYVVSHLMTFSMNQKSYHKTLLILIVSSVTLSILTQASASFVSDNYFYAYAASKNKNDTTTGDTSTDGTTPSTPIGSKTFLTVTTKVSGGVSKPSDFTISVSGKSPSPKSFSGSSTGTSVTLNAGNYKVTASGPSDYTTSYSSGCSGTASGGTPIKCTISNQYRTKPSPPQPPVPNITITTNSNSVYSIPSTSVQVDRFSTNYIIAGTISSLIYSKDLITSTIVNDFDKNPNIGYIVNDSSGSQAPSTPPPTSSQTQLGIPNPFVSIDLINQKITNVIQNAMEATEASSSNSPQKHVEIKCTFGMILDDYNCS
jgi:Prealbumin-like fold domain